MMRKISVQSALAVTAFSACVVFAPVCAQDAEEPAAAEPDMMVSTTSVSYWRVR